MTSRRATDFRPMEIAIAVSFAFAVECTAALALSAAALDRPAMLPEIDKGQAVPVRVTPVLDLDSPLLKLGGKKDRYKLPDRWVRQTPIRRVEEKVFASTKAGKSAKDIPEPDKKLADAGTKPPPEDAAVAKQVDTPLVDMPDAALPSNVDTEGSPDGVKEGTETDPLKARAVDLYRARIAGWFSGRFRVSGSGLTGAALTSVRVRATVQLSGRSVASYQITPSGNAAFDAAARQTLESVKGQEIPPPPENYPNVVQQSIQVTFVCREGRCD